MNDTRHVVVIEPAFCAQDCNFFNIIGVKRPGAGLIAKEAKTAFRQVLQGKSCAGRGSTRQGVD
jgi:hypothetical protein